MNKRFHKQGFALAVLCALMFVLRPLVHATELGQETLIGNEDQLAESLVELIREVSHQRYPEGPVGRLNQVKTLGCLRGEFSVLDNIPAGLKYGVFAAEKTYPVYARFANASQLDDREKDLRGLSLRLANVEGEPLWGETGLQDFLFNSYPALFADSPETFFKFIEAQRDDALLSFFLNPFDSHLSALGILLNARDTIYSPLDIHYYSTTAFRLGPEHQAVKYRVSSCSDYKSDAPESLGPDFLQQAMIQHLAAQNVCLTFAVQVQKDPQRMPVEDPSVIWDASESPFIDVAQLRFKQQAFASDQAIQSCENASFNPWQGLAAHKPLGRVNYVRRLVYEKLAALRKGRQ